MSNTESPVSGIFRFSWVGVDTVWERERERHSHRLMEMISVLRDELKWSHFNLSHSLSLSLSLCASAHPTFMQAENTRVSIVRDRLLLHLSTHSLPIILLLSFFLSLFHSTHPAALSTSPLRSGLCIVGGWGGLCCQLEEGTCSILEEHAWRYPTWTPVLSCPALPSPSCIYSRWVCVILSTWIYILCTLSAAAAAGGQGKSTATQ